MDILAYAAGAWGANPAACDLDADGRDEILAGPGPGPTLGPHVRGFTRGGAFLAKVSFYAYGTLQFGVDVAGADADGDGFGEILTGAGPGAVFGPHVRGFDYDAVRVAPIAALSYYAYGTLRFGVQVAGGDLDGDVFDEILTGPGPGPAFGATVRGWQHDGAGLLPMTKVSFNAYGYHRGVHVAGGDVDGDTFDEIATAPGPDPLAPLHIRGFDYDATTVAPLPGHEDVRFGSALGGTVDHGDLAGDGREEVVLGPGPDPAAAATVRELLYDGSRLTLHPATPFLAFPTSYGVVVAAGTLR